MSPSVNLCTDLASEAGHSLLTVALVSSDSQKAFLVALWIRVGDDLWGIDTVSPLSQNADGLYGEE